MKREKRQLARVAAVATLLAVSEDGARANAALRRLLKEGRVEDPRDRALATELVYGVLRWQRRLDHALSPWVRQGLERLEPMARAFLRLGAYQILFLDRMPAPIAVSATQDAARAMGAGRLTGLINGVLRRVNEKKERLPKTMDDNAIGVRASLPTWVVGSLRQVFGDDGLEQEAMALRDRGVTTVRATLEKGGPEKLIASLAGEGFTAQPGPHGVLTIQGAGDPFATEAFGEGLFVPQNPASLAVIDLLEVTESDKVLDICAGRGIKATALADRGVTVLAVDVDGKKLVELEALAERLGVKARIQTRTLDACVPTPDLGMFSHVLVDAPCSGLGTLVQHPEIAWRVSPAQVERLAELQGRILNNAARHVAVDGILLYAVCTFTEAEGNPPTPVGFEPTGAPIIKRPSEGMDAFRILRWRRLASDG